MDPFDLSPARAYGDLIIMFPPAHNLQVVSAPLVAESRRLLKDFSDEDYLLMIGNPVMFGIVCAIAADTNGGRFKALVWDKKFRSYLEYKVNTRGSQT